MTKFYFLLITASALISQTTFAGEPDSEAEKSAFTYSGYIDASYNYLEKSNQFISETNDRVFDLNENGITLQQAATTVAYQPEHGFGGLMNLTVGRDAYTLAAFGTNPDRGLEWFGFDITQVYLQYAIAPLTFIGGKFNSLAGYEATDPSLDTNFSRGLLSGFAVPGTITGIRGIYTVNEKINFTAGVNDGWDNIRDWGRKKTIELGIAYTPTPRFSVSAQTYSGEERITSFVSTGPTGRRNIFDIFATFNATEKLSLILNYDYGWQTKALLPDENSAEAIWTGIAGYINYQFNDHWRLSLRGEWFDDKDGFRTGVAQTLREATITVGYAPIKALEIRAETRRDYSNVDAFLNKHGHGVSDHQQSYAVEVITKFG